MRNRGRELLLSCLLLLLVGTRASAGLAPAATGPLETESRSDAVPVFPFQNTKQLGPGIPGLMPYQGPEVAFCPDGVTMLVVFMFGHYTPAEGAHGWQVWVEQPGTHFTGAFFDGGTTPKAVYMGTVNEENGYVTVLRSEPFDPQKHHHPCETWK